MDTRGYIDIEYTKKPTKKLIPYGVDIDVYQDYILINRGQLIKVKNPKKEPIEAKKEGESDYEDYLASCLKTSKENEKTEKMVIHGLGR